MIKLHIISFFVILLSISAQAKSKIFHFTDVQGPSKISGDCSGHSIWLKLDVKTETFVSGQVNEYEGGCKAYPKDIVQIKHNPKTGKLSFYADYLTGDTYIKFDGIYHYETLAISTKIYQINQSDLKPKSDYKRMKTLIMVK